MSSDPTIAQAQALLQTLFKFMLPLIQKTVDQTMDLKNIRFGIEADEFVTELEKFISSLISRSQLRSQDTVAIEARLGKDTFYRTEEDEVTIGARSNDIGNSEDIHTDQSMIQHSSVPQSMPLGSNEEDLGKNLRDLRQYVTQKMPIRLLCFEPHNSNLQISLLDRTAIYNHIVLKLRADFNLTTFCWQAYVGYAILSHTWTQKPGELTYADWQRDLALDATQPKSRKLVNFCKAAYENHGLAFGWIDTVCINKESSSELDESIRSMYTWYCNAEICITYLAGSKAIEDIRNDPWFTRGWTLQELVAPRRIKFYNVDWNQLCPCIYDDKKFHSIRTEITLATTITMNELSRIRGASISRRMQLAAKRQVTRGEDIAYCLMGIFDVSISTAYGEGAERAFFRLVEEILRSTKDVSDIFNWAGDKPPHGRHAISSLFPSRPSDYLNRSSNGHLWQWHTIEPLTLTHLGLRIPVLLMPAVPCHELALPNLIPPIGLYYASVASVDLHPGMFIGNPSQNYLLLASCSQQIYMNPNKLWYNGNIDLTFGTLNVEEHGTSIHVPKTCLAVLLKQEVKNSPLGYKRMYTKEPIVFDLKKTDNDEDKHYYQIERKHLAKHGMELVTLYL